MYLNLKFYFACLICSLFFVQLGFAQPCEGMNPTIIQKDLALTTTEEYDSYQWYLNGEMISGATEKEYIPESDGDYTVVVSKMSDQFNFIPSSRLDDNISLFSIYPNPTNGNVYIKSNQLTNQTISVKLTDINGRSVIQKEFINNSKEFEKMIDLSNIDSGVYFIEVKDGDKISVESLVIE